MPISLENVIAKMPEEMQEAVKKRTAELVEEVTLRQLREARKQSQKDIAKKLHVKQAAVSKLERRADVLVSTLREYIESIGGSLEIIARFPNQDVKICQFQNLGAKPSAKMVPNSGALI